MTFIEKLNNALNPYYALLITLGFFGTLLLALFNFIFSPTDLKVNVQTSEMNYPQAIGKQYEKIFKNIDEKDVNLMLDAVSVYGFIIKTTEQKTIIIENVSDKTLRDINFKHINTEDITAYSISSDYFNKNEEQILYDNLIYDNKRGITYLKELIDLPPRKSIKIKLWGSFKKSLIENDVIVSHSDGDAFFDTTYVISGLKGFFVNYLYEFLLIIVVIFGTIYHYGLSYAVKKSPKSDN